MSAEDLACCLKCQMTFTTHEELFVHSCIYIKVESNEFEESTALDFSNERDFKHDIVQSNSSEGDSDYSRKKKKCKQRKMSKRKVENVRKIGEDSPKIKGKMKRHKIKKEKPKYEFDEEPNILEEEKSTKLSEGMNLDLTEEFIIFILQQVDELCENIKNGDPDNERTLEVNQNLNNAVSCYRGKLDLEKQITFIQSDNEDAADINYYPEIPKEKGKKRKLKKEILNDEKVKFVKDQCGKHSVNIMSCMLNMNYSTLQQRIEKEKIKFTEKQEECYFCELKKHNDAIDKTHLFPLLKYNHDKKKIECAVCNYSKCKDRGQLFTHIKSIHKNEINAIAAGDKEEKNDCEKSECRKLYGMMEGKAFWCAKCVEVSELPPSKRPKDEPASKQKLCPECGISVQHLKAHLDNVHFPEKQICPHCDQELRSKHGLSQHIKKVHEKVPCSECGKLVGDTACDIKRHMESAHAPNHKLKYKCDICFKRFAAKQRLEDHKNVHTGEKPHKCQFCSACFASFGNMRMHERGHLGHKRK